MSTPVVMLPSLGRGASDFDALLGALHAEGFDGAALEPPSEMPAGSTHGRRYVAMHPGIARLVEIEGAGHALRPERPAAVAAAVLEFLRDR